MDGFFYKDAFVIKQPTKFVMPSKKERKMVSNFEYLFKIARSIFM